MNNYEVAEIVEIGKAHEVILGSTKAVQLYPDSPSQILRNQEEEEDDE
jgi:hypothetical protein